MVFKKDRLSRTKKKSQTTYSVQDKTLKFITLFTTKDMYTVEDRLLRNYIPCLGQRG